MQKVVDDVTVPGRVCMALRPAVCPVLFGVGILLGLLIGR